MDLMFFGFRVQGLGFRFELGQCRIRVVSFRGAQVQHGQIGEDTLFQEVRGND